MKIAFEIFPILMLFGTIKSLDFFLEKEQFVARKFTINSNLIDHFTIIVHLVVLPLNES